MHIYFSGAIQSLKLRKDRASQMKKPKKEAVAKILTVVVIIFAIVIAMFWSPGKRLTIAVSKFTPSRDEKKKSIEGDAVKKIQSLSKPVVSKTELLPETVVTKKDSGTDNLELPSPFFKGEQDTPIGVFAAVKAWKNMDFITSKWTNYAILRDKLRKEASDECANKAIDEVIEAARQLRNKFWEANDLSTAPYIKAYKARAIFENLQELHPENLNIIDELIETIQTTDVLRKIDGNKKIRNQEVVDNILSLREKEFDLIRMEVEQNGRTPTLDDFVRVYDLAYLQQFSKRASAQTVVAWLQKYKDIGRWNGYSDVLAKFQNVLGQKSTFICPIYVALNTTCPKEYDYQRRTPSFKGPSIRDVVAWGTIDKNDERFSVAWNNNNIIVTRKNQNGQSR